MCCDDRSGLKLWRFIGVVVMPLIVLGISAMDWIFSKSQYVWLPLSPQFNSTELISLGQSGWCELFPVFCFASSDQLATAITFSVDWFWISWDWMRIPVVLLDVYISVWPEYTVLYLPVIIINFLYGLSKLVQLSRFLYCFVNCSLFLICFQNMSNGTISPPFMYTLIFSLSDLVWLPLNIVLLFLLFKTSRIENPWDFVNEMDENTIAKRRLTIETLRNENDVLSKEVERLSTENRILKLEINEGGGEGETEKRRKKKKIVNVSSRELGDKYRSVETRGSDSESDDDSKGSTEE